MKVEQLPIIHDCIAFILVREDKVLVEHRQMNKISDPGATTFPGGHVQHSEKLEDALFREMQEELNVTPNRFHYLATYLNHSQEQQMVHYFVIHSWIGDIQNHEAEFLEWISTCNSDRLDIQADRLALRDYRHAFQITNVPMD